MDNKIVPSSGNTLPGSSKKIPRPPNSFLIYRKEHATKYAGLVATELSTKLAMAWKKESPERKAHYAALAEQAKQEHAIKFPGYKFTPAKRGTGKRALQLAASAEAARRAALGATSSPDSFSHKILASPSPSSSTSTATAFKKRANSNVLSRSASLTLPETMDQDLMSINSIQNNARPARSVSRTERYIPSNAPYPGASMHKRASYSHSSTSGVVPSQRGCSSSLLFSSGSCNQVFMVGSHLGASSFLSTSSPSPTIPSQTINTGTVFHRSDYGESSSELSDFEIGGDDEDSDSQQERYSNDQVLHAIVQEQQDHFNSIESSSSSATSISSDFSLDPSGRPTYWMHSPLLMDTASFAEPLTIEGFEPECLASHDASIWASAPDVAGSPSASMMRQLFEQYQQHNQQSYGLQYNLHQTQEQQQLQLQQYQQQQVQNHSTVFLHGQTPTTSSHSIQSNMMDMSPKKSSPLSESDLTATTANGNDGQESNTAIQFSIEMDRLQRDLASLLPSPVSTPLQHPYMTLSSLNNSSGNVSSGQEYLSTSALPLSTALTASSATVMMPSHQQSFQFPLMQEDVMMSPALSTCSSISSLGGVGANGVGVSQDPHSYFANAIELL
ncbi:hypothetical protein BGZ94_000539 [Podila epigama]|nr:hypothetical protein BGZ94_000539 [Podila epigama]